MRRPFAAVVTALALMVCVRASANARELSLEDRLEAQAAIERVYYSHQVGTTKPFEEAVPRQLLEKKVSTYLKQSAALDQYWRTPVTGEMLARELERIARGTRMPERLPELFAALDDDPVLVQECLVRPALVDRLARSFYAFDGRLHATSKREADSLREALATGALDPSKDHPRRTEVEVVEDAPGGRSRADTGIRDPSRVDEEMGTRNRLTLSPAEFTRWRDHLRRSAGEVTTIGEDRDAFRVRVLLDDAGPGIRVAEYRFEKMPWDEWWAEVSSRLNGASIATGALPVVSLPDRFGAARPAWTPGGPNEGSESGTADNVCTDDAWDNGSMDDLPHPRSHHTVVWTGSVMVVWGGLINSNYSPFNTGGRYDPATDTWTPTSTVGAPSPRYFHTAVWTGSRMVAWGGYDDITGMACVTGGRYDPATDTWTPTSTVGAPSPRYGHTAVWTGNRNLMVVWGGADPIAATKVDTGGRYNPATDTWTPTSTVGAPSARSSHTTVWTGSLMRW